jgi:predicted nucleic acid-binding protein
VKLVIDTDVVVAAMRSPSGASAAILHELHRGALTLVLSVTQALEYEAVCRLPQHRAPSGLTLEDADGFVQGIVCRAGPAHIHFRWRPQLRDPGDEMVLEAAINGGADAIVTFNKRDFGGGPARFGIEVLSPGEALWKVRR